MARAIVALLLACGLLHAAAALAQSGPGFGVSAGMGLVSPDGDAPGSGRGVYADVEYLPRRDRWFTPRLYAGAVVAGSRDDCGAGIAPCDVSARVGFAGAKGRLLIPVPWVGPFVELGMGGSVGRFRTRSGQAADVSKTGATYHIPVALGLALGKRHQWQLKFSYLFHPELKQVGGGAALGLEFSPASPGRGEGAVAGQEPVRADGGAPRARGGASGGIERILPEPAPPIAPGPILPEPSPPVASGPISPEPSPPVASAPITSEPSPPVAPPVAAVPPAEPAPTGCPPRGKRRKTYTAVWLGYGGGTVDRRDDATEFLAYVGLLLPQSAGVGFGVPVGRRVELGGEWNITLGFNCGVGSINSASGPCDRVVLLQHLLATATVFPLRPAGERRVAPRGLFVRGGGGLAMLNSWYSQDVSDPSSPSPGAEPGAKDWRRVGAGVLAGIGYALGGESRSRLDVGIDLAWQWYGRSTWEPERSFSTVIRLGATIH